MKGKQMRGYRKRRGGEEGRESIVARVAEKQRGHGRKHREWRKERRKLSPR